MHTHTHRPGRTSLRPRERLPRLAGSRVGAAELAFLAGGRFRRFQSGAWQLVRGDTWNSPVHTADFSIPRVHPVFF